MKKLLQLRNVFAIALTAMVLYTVSVREVHYLFAQHAVEEHCENHLHSQEGHGHCAVCKFDVSLFTNDISTPELPNQKHFVALAISSYSCPVHSSVPLTQFLRGPPAIA